MVKQDFVYDAVHVLLEDEVKRVRLECENIGIFITKKLAMAVVAEKSKRGKMSEIEIKEYVKKLRGICTT